jgi:hypothetical protein
MNDRSSPVTAVEWTSLPVVPAQVSRLRRGKSLKQQIILWGLVAALLLILGLTVYLGIQFSPAPNNPT